MTLMAETSDRQTGAFDNPARMACREGCLPRRELTSEMLLKTQGASPGFDWGR
jgi:hypothetical protein